jgi:hypothetical protein
MNPIKIVVLFLTFAFVFLLAGESYAHPRYRLVKVHRYKPKHKVVVVEPYYVVKHEKVILVKRKHHHKRVRIIMY